MTLNIVYKSAVPARPYDDDLFCLPVAAVPYVLGALRLRMYRYFYTSEEDFVRGVSLLSEFCGGLLMPCAQDIINRLDAMRVLVDASLNDVTRTVSGAGTKDDPYVYSPALEQSADGKADNSPSMLYQLVRTRAYLDNLVNGNTSSVSPSEAVTNAKLEAIRLLLEAMGGEDGPTFEQVAQVIAILGV